MPRETDDLFDFAAGIADGRAKKRLLQQLTQADSALSQQLRETAEGTPDAANTFADDFVSEAGDELAVHGNDRYRSVSRLRRYANRIVLLVLGGLLVTGASYGGWWLLSPAPLLEDSLQSRVFRADLWRTPRAVVKPHQEFLVLRNRGYLVTAEEFPQPIAISFDWYWLEPDVYAPQFSEHLCVALRSSGQPSRAYPYEMQDGVSVLFNTWSNNIQIRQASHPAAITRTNNLSVPMLAEEWHRIRIEDDGRSIAVYMKGPRIEAVHWKQPLLRVAYPNKGDKFYIAIYNRELVGGVHHESRIRNFTIMPLAP
jgi:hypothetical protein